MKLIPSARWSVYCAAVCLLMSTGPLVSAQTPARAAVSSASTKPLVEQARELLADGKAVQALAIARRATQETPADYKASYYVAYALMELGEYAEATRHIEQGLQLANSAEAKAAVTELRGQLEAVSTLKDADTAAADGLHAKAARLYLQVWERGVLPPQKTLEAAELFLNQMKDTATAARLLRDIPVRYKGTPDADQALKRLAELQPSLKTVAEEALAHAHKEVPGDPARKKWLEAALEANPNMQNAVLMLTNDAAEAGDWPLLERQLKLLQRGGTLQGLLEGRSLVLGKWQSDPRLVGLLSDIWGEKRARELLGMNTASAQTLSPEAAAESLRRTRAKAMSAFEAAGLKAGTGVAFRDCGNCPEMLWLPPGAMPQVPVVPNSALIWVNRVRFDYPLAVGKFEVTFDEWDACTAEGACRAVEEGHSAGLMALLTGGKWGRGRQPVINVSWEDAAAYTQWLSKKSGQTYRLLSLPEFAYAARAGRTSGLLIDGGANCPGCSPDAKEQTLAVGSFPPNAWGLHDMIGNVSEMLADCDIAPARLTEITPDGSPNTVCATPPRELGLWRLMSGGSWLGASTTAVSLSVHGERSAFSTKGFRVARVFTP